jgi:transcriptional regulator with XRE-family HTH domain
MNNARPVGALLRDWRQRRRLSQLALSSQANVSTRHLSFVESGRSTPSRELLLHLAERLDVPLRERNRLLLAAGYAPGYAQRSLEDPEMQAAQRAVRQVLNGHDPYPALAVDSRWNLVAANRSVAPLLVDVAPKLLEPPLNVLRLSLHPEGLASRIVNLTSWRAHLFARLARDIEVRADPWLNALARELQAYPLPHDAARNVTSIAEPNELVVPLLLRASTGVLSLISTTTVFGSPLEVSLSELAIEAFFPADAATAEALRQAQTARD